jgi:hypothetical protein
MVIIGDPTAEDVSFSFYTYQITDNAAAVNDFVEGISNTASTTNTLVTVATGDLAETNDKNGNAFTGFGHAVAIADSCTVFVSQASASAQTGRVIVYEGNITSFKQTQLLIPYDGAHRLDSDSFFGESIAAKPSTLAAGCQSCNTSAPMFSGAVYVYTPNKSGRWSESQVLTSEGILFLGEHVAMHNRVLVATGDDLDYVQAAEHKVGNVPNSAVIFEEEEKGKGKGGGGEGMSRDKSCKPAEEASPRPRKAFLLWRCLTRP